MCLQVVCAVPKGWEGQGAKEIMQMLVEQVPLLS